MKKANRLKIVVNLEDKYFSDESGHALFFLLQDIARLTMYNRTREPGLIHSQSKRKDVAFGKFYYDDADWSVELE